MKPTYRITADETDVTDHIEDRFVSLTVMDHSGFHNDRVSLVLDDRDPPVALTGYQTRLRVWMGYLDDPRAEDFPEGLHFMGTFYVDEIQVSKSPARTVTITGRSNDTSKNMKSAKTRSWEAITLGEMIEIIASEHAYTVNVHPVFASLYIEHLEQIGQSDQGWLTLLANKYDAIFKITDDVLFFGPRALSSTASDVPVTTISMPEGYLTSWDIVMQMRSDHQNSTSRHYDDDQARELVAETPASEDPLNQSEALEQDIAVDSEEADQWSRAQVGRLNREKETLSFSCVGIPQIRAETQMDISGIRSGLRSTWLIVSTRHTISRSGYKTTGECEVPDTSLEPVETSPGEPGSGTGTGGGDPGDIDGGTGGNDDSEDNTGGSPGGTLDPEPPEPPPDGYGYYVESDFENGQITNPPGGAWSGGTNSTVAEVPD